jgi:segregation and condensation protein B
VVSGQWFRISDFEFVIWETTVMPDPTPDSDADAALESPASAAATDGPTQDDVESGGGGGISLDKLSAAFAEMLRPSDQQAATAEGAGAQEQSEGQPDSPPAGVEQAKADWDDVEVSPRNLLEAMLFVGDPAGEPLTSQQIIGLIRGVSARDVQHLVEQLNETYCADGSPYEIVSRGAGYQLALRDGFESIRARFYGRIREARLSQAAIDVLAVVAYRGPVTADQVSQLRAAPSRAILSQLVRRQLIRIERPEETPRSPVYRTTDRFLRLFNLTSLNDLPRSETPVDGGVPPP